MGLYTNPLHNACSDQLISLSPIPQDNKNRKLYSYDENETRSLKERFFSKLNVTRKYPQFEKGSEKISATESLIIDHFEMRIAALYQQLITCSNTPYHFEIGDTISQADSSHKIDLKDGKGALMRLDFHSAHSATIPCLHAYDRKKWDKISSEDPILKPKDIKEKMEGFVYLQSSYSYRVDNSTNGLLRAVNNADSEIDGDKDDAKLRYFAIQIINDVAAGKTNPIDGMRKFIKEAQAFIQERVDAKEASRNKNAEKSNRQFILEIYLGVLSDLKPTVKDDTFFDQLTSFDASQCRILESVKRMQGITQLLRDEHYQKIRRHNELEAIAMRTLEVQANEIKKDIVKRIKEKKIGGKFCYFDLIFKRMLIESATGGIKKMLMRLLCQGEADLRLLVEGCKYLCIEKGKVMRHHMQDKKAKELEDKNRQILIEGSVELVEKGKSVPFEKNKANLKGKEILVFNSEETFLIQGGQISTRVIEGKPLQKAAENTEKIIKGYKKEIDQLIQELRYISIKLSWIKLSSPVS